MRKKRLRIKHYPLIFDTIRLMKSRQPSLIRIGFASDFEQKAVRDCYSGLLRFLASSEQPSEVRTINPNAATDAELLQFRDWLPVGIITVPEFLSVLTSRLSRHRLGRHITIYLNRENITRSSANVMDICIDNKSLAEAAVSLLMKRGLVNFAYVDELERPNEAARSKARGDAFTKIVERTKFACARYSYTLGNGENWSSELHRLADWLEVLPKPCGIMAYADICAKRIYDACHIARLRIPDQIRIVGVDNDTSLCENISPPLTSIEPDFELSGYLAGQLLFNKLTRTHKVNPVCMTYGVKSIIERASTQDVKGSGRIVTAACEIIRLNASEGIDVATVATRLNVSRRLLEMRFRDVLGIGVAEELRRVRLENVCRQLRNTGLSIGEISAKSGFSSPSHLNALFRNSYGMTMREWRKSNNTCNKKT